MRYQSFTAMSRRKKRSLYAPSDIVWPAPEAWKEQVDLKMRINRITRRALAQVIGCTPSAITILFREATKTSKLVEPISRFVGVAPPVAEIRDERDLRWLEAGKALSESDWNHMVEIAERLASNNVNTGE